METIPPGNAKEEDNQKGCKPYHDSGLQQEKDQGETIPNHRVGLQIGLTSMNPYYQDPGLP